MKKIKKYIKRPRLFIIFLFSKFKFKFLSDKFYIKIRYKNTFDKKIDFSNVKTFNEKLQWLKLNDRKDIYKIMVDKYKVKEYVSNLIGEEFIIPTIGVYDKFEEIDFDNLPNQFVIKCNHDSGGLIVVKDKTKLNIEEAKKIVNKSLKRNYYYFGREWPYKNVKPKIIIEKYMEDKKLKELRDYKFFCFNGKVKIFKIDFDRFKNHKANYYDINKNLLPFGEVACPPDFNKELIIPNNFKKLIELSEKLSANIAFLRVDFYEVNNKIYFGELTFYPNSGFGKFCPLEWDLKLGDMLDITNVKKIKLGD